MPHCSDIVAIGRVKWIEGSKHTGKDNACWYMFDSRHTAGPVFHWRDQGEVDPFKAHQIVRAMRQALRAVATIQFTVLLAGVQAERLAQEA